MTPRPPDRRKADALAKLAAHNADVWVASASPDGVAHLVPLSFAWDGEHVVLAVEPDSRTALNVLAAGKARLALGHTRDVVMIDAVLARTSPVDADDAAALAEAYARQCDWDPRAGRGPFVFLVLRLRRVQVWKEADEIAGRTVMRGGDWLV